MDNNRSLSTIEANDSVSLQNRLSNPVQSTNTSEIENLLLFHPNILKSEYVEKQSKYLKQWRRRYLVLTPCSLLAYAPDSDYECTMHLYNENISSVELDDDTLIKILERDDVYYLKASNREEAKSWRDIILNTIRSN